MMTSRALATAALAALIAGCAGHSGAPGSNFVPDATREPSLMSPGKYIKHIVIIVQENRSFENIFAGFPGADAPMTGKMSDGTTVALHAMSFHDDQDIGHMFKDALKGWDNGKMDGFDTVGFGTFGTGAPVGKYVYSYLKHAEIKPYLDMASQYELVDHMFPTEFGTSFTSHQDLIAGTTRIDSTHSLVDVPTFPPWTCGNKDSRIESPLVNTNRVVTQNGPKPCFNEYGTIADSLDAASVSWKYYAPVVGSFESGVWSPFAAIKKIYYGPDFKKNVVSPETKVLTDAGSDALPSVAWVVPHLDWSDHPISTTTLGPSWVAAVVNAIGKSKDWDSTAIVVLWDDWGGWYDSAPPPQLDYVGLGVRVPCMIVSPYVKKGSIAHTTYEYGSLLKFMEQVFHLKSLGTTDVRATSILNAFDFTQPPRKFVPISAPTGPAYFLSHAGSSAPPDPI